MLEDTAVREGVVRAGSKHSFITRVPSGSKLSMDEGGTSVAA